MANALLVINENYELPAPEEEEYEVESNFRDYDPADLAAVISGAVFDANQVEHAALNSVEVFVNKHTVTVHNSRGLHKTQHGYSAIVEAIPTYNGAEQSVELYEQYNFITLDENALRREISGKMTEVKARCEATKPELPLSCTVILNTGELSVLFFSIADALNYGSVCTNSNLFHKGDRIQKAPEGDLIGITMTGEASGCVSSAKHSHLDNAQRKMVFDQRLRAQTLLGF